MASKSEIIFISDLHISLEKTEITKRFLSFLQQRMLTAKSLYILGDLFDAWIGDDDNTPPNPAIKKALKQLSDSGADIFLLQGNRDFLLGSKFCQATGVILLDDFSVIELQGQNVLLTHGDLLCSDDLAYQAFRQKSRSAEWQCNVLSKPLFLRLLAAKWYRFRSYFHKRQKTQEIMDVNQDTVRSVMQDFNCDTLIHGHTHRPGQHEFLIEQRSAKRLVLADWKKERAEILCWNNGEWRIEVLD
jgi:UDP-2,3-diacylglucosamine hydrolase